MIDFKFSVLMAVYKKDDPDLFLKALESVFSNSLIPNEFVLVADGMLTCELYSIIDSFRNKQFFKVIQLENNMGLATALNEGMRHITYEWVFRADSDDHNLKDRFFSLASVIADSKFKLSIIGSYVSEHDKNGKYLSLKKVPTDYNSIVKYISIRNPFNHMSVAFTKSAFNTVGGYPNVYLKEDYALWILMLGNNLRGINIPLPLVEATTGDNFYVRRSGWRSAISELIIYKLLFRNGFASSPLTFFVFLCRFLILILPSFMIKIVYIFFLRR